MRKLYALLIPFLFFMSFSSCSTFPYVFTTEKIMKVHQGMSSDDVLALFGQPKSVRASVCGKPPNQWNCTTWEYGGAVYGDASFTFSGEQNELILNNFDINRP